MKRMIFFIAVALFLALTGCGNTSSPQPVSSSQVGPSPGDFVLPAEPKGIAAAAVELRALPDYLEIAARLQADPTRVVRVFPPLGGRLLTVEVRPGDRVRQGQTLATLVSSELGAARADYQKARADAEVKEKGLRRSSLLYENQVLSEKEYQQAQAELEMAQAELERARARLHILGVDPESSSDEMRVRAPRTGAVLDVGAAPGELSKSLDSPAPLCTLADLSVIWAVGDVYEKDLASLKVGEPAEVVVNAYPGRKLRGAVAALSDVMDPVTRTLKVRVVLSNPGWRLKPEMFAAIRLMRSVPQGIVIPASAVLREGSTASVFVEKSPGRFERRRVTLGRALDQQVEVISGLKPGETVITEGALLLQAATR